MKDTVFNDAYHTIQERMTHLMIPLINEAFGSSYNGDEEIELLGNEHQKPDKRTSFSHLQIGKTQYHIECRSRDDSTMELRMFEDDYMNVIEDITCENERYKINFPKFCVIYLHGNKNAMPDLFLDVCMPNGGQKTYRAPMVNVSDYCVNDIFEKKLFVFLPFYVTRYEMDAAEIEKSNDEIDKLAQEYEYICDRLRDEYKGRGKNNELVRLMELIICISDYVFRNQKNIRKRINDLVNGKVIDLMG